MPGPDFSLDAYEGHAAALRAADLSARASNKARNKLRLDHGEFLAKFTQHAFAELPKMDVHHLQTVELNCNQ